MSTPVFFPQCKFHAGIVEALTIHLVCQHHRLRKVVQRQAELELGEAAVHQLPHLRTRTPDATKAFMSHLSVRLSMAMHEQEAYFQVVSA